MTVFARYGAVLRGQGTAGPLTASIVGRLSLGMATFALLLLVRDTYGSYAVAGLVSGSYALAFGLLGPSLARVADRTGPLRALRLTAVLHPLLLIVVVLAAHARVDVLMLLVPVVLAGATVPPHGAVMRALWASTLSGPALATAYSLESVAVELCFVLGPLLVAALTPLAGPTAPVLAAGALATVGALWLSATPRVRGVRPGQDRHGSRFGPLSSGAVRALLVTVLGVGLSFGAVEVAVPAFVETRGGSGSSAGVLIAVWSAGSVVGGLVYGGLQLQAPSARQLPLLVTALAVGTALPLLADGTGMLGVVLFVFGLTVAPFMACNAVLLGSAAPAGTVTEAFAWNTSMIFSGAALGGGLAGVLVEHFGPTAGLLLTAAGGLAALASSSTGAASRRRRAGVPTVSGRVS